MGFVFLPAEPSIFWKADEISPQAKKKKKEKKKTSRLERGKKREVSEGQKTRKFFPEAGVHAKRQQRKKTKIR